MTQETDRSILVQRILSRMCVHCGSDLMPDNSCDACNRQYLTAKVEHLRETLNGKIQSVKTLINNNNEKLDEINIIVEEIKRLNSRTNRD
jgi:methionyl-tRNA synthetase